MTGKCKLKECGAPGIPCHLGYEDHTTCVNWIENSIEQKVKKDKSIHDLKKSNLSWSGQSLSSDGLSVVSRRTSPVLIGIVGKVDAGKTSFLAMVYTLLLNGKKLKGYDFSGTKTILGWDELYQKLRMQKGEVAFPSPTPVSSNRLYHFALRDSDGQLKDVLFSDASGEVFTLWSQNREDLNAENARWIYANSSGFILFIDYEALIRQKNLAKREIVHIAQQLTHDLKERPVIAVWSKADKKKEIHPRIERSLHEELQNLFTNFTEIEISNFLEPGPDEFVHKNNLKAIDWLINKIMIESSQEFVISKIKTDDIFLNYRGK